MTAAGGGKATEGAGGGEKGTHRRRWVWRGRPIITKANALDVLNRVLTLVILVVVGIEINSYREFTTCVARYDDQSARANAARSQAAQQDRDAEDAFLQALQDAGNPAKVPPAGAQKYAQAAFATYVNQRADTNRQRALHPLPVGPSQVCH